MCAGTLLFFREWYNPGMGGSWKTRAILLLLLVPASGRALAGRRLELSVSYGRWSSFPFTTLIEKQCKKMVDHELRQLLGWASTLLTLRNDKESIEFSSGGYAVRGELKYSFPASRLSASLEASWQHLDLPYDLEFQQRVELIGIPIAQAHTVASGTARIRGPDASTWIHWRVGRVRKIECSVAAGLHLMPLKGDVSLQGHSSLKTIAGDSELDLDGQETMTELREDGLNIPRVLVFPALALSASTWFSRNFGMQARLSLSQGVFLSLGLVVGI